MEQAEIPDVGGGPAPSAKVIDLSAMRSTPEKDAPPDIPKETEAPSVSVTEYSKREWEKPMPEPEKPKPKRGRPAKAERATPTEPGAKKEVKAEKPRRGRPPKTEKTAPEQTKPPKAGKTHAAPEEKAAPPAPEVPPTPRDATRAEKEEIVYLDLSDLHPFKDHPFGVRDDAEMKSLVESVRNGGVNQPALVRPREGGGYLYDYTFANDNGKNPLMDKARAYVENWKEAYVWLAISIDPVYIDTGNWIESAAGLCYECLNDIALDVFGMTGNDHDFEDADPLELAEIKRRWKPYIGQLPEYAYLCDELLSRSK